MTELDLTEAIQAGAQAIRDANAPEAWTSTHLIPAHVYAEAALGAAAPSCGHVWSQDSVTPAATPPQTVTVQGQIIAESGIDA